MKYLFSTVFLILTSSLCLSQDIVVDKNPSDPTGFVTVKFKLSKGDDVQWEVSPKPTDKRTFIDGDYSYLIFNGPADKTYTVTADWINWDAKKRGRPTSDVVIGKLPPPTPPPTPPPPVPPPSPVPFKVDKAWIFVIEDATVARTVDVAKFLNDPYWQTVKPKNEWRHYRSDSSTAIQAGYVNEAKSVGYPAVVILDAKDGTVLKKFKSSSVVDVDSALKEVVK